MSDHAVVSSDAAAHPVAGHAPALAEIDFDKSELARFDHDDVKAGGSIGKMLGLIFLYTIIAMSIAGWWTFRAITR